MTVNFSFTAFNPDLKDHNEPENDQRQRNIDYLNTHKHFLQYI